MASKLPCLLDTASKFALFSVSGFKAEKFIKSKPTWKLKHANSILETFEYFCQKSSKSICTILSYTVSKLVHFFETQCIAMTQLNAIKQWNELIWFNEIIQLQQSAVKLRFCVTSKHSVQLHFSECIRVNFANYFEVCQWFSMTC